MNDPSLPREVDVAIVGAGTAGLSAWRAAREHTERVLLIDPGPLGTTCARVGCMPSKLLIAAAEAAHAVAHAGRFGIDGAPPHIDGVRVMERVRSERDRFVRLVREDIARTVPAGQLLGGTARFTGPGRLLVSGPGWQTPVHARRTVLATGSRPDVPGAWHHALGELLISSDAVFDWVDLPASVAVVGTGSIGLELAQALHRLGVRVRLFGQDLNVGMLTDPVLQREAGRLFAALLPLEREAQLLDVSRERGAGPDGRDAVALHWRTPRGEQRDRFDLLLAATGRTPNLDRLAIEQAGLPLDDRGRPPHDRTTMRVADTPVFLAGDASADRPLLHEASDEGLLAGRNAAREAVGEAAVAEPPRRTALSVVFCDPQMMVAGQSHRALRQAKVAFTTGRADFGDQGRSRVMGRNAGALHLYADPATHRLLGAEMLGPDAEHIGHLLAWSIGRGDTVDDCLAQPFYHPVVEEGVRTALRDLRHALKTPPGCDGCAPGD